MRKFAPLPDNHPLVTKKETCPACQKVFITGDVTTLIALGPGDNPESRKRARDGRAYTAVAIPVHWACATGEEDL